MAEFRLETPRLLLREWRATDLDALALMNADPDVMAFIGPLQGRADAAAQIEGFQADQAMFGYCCWALERRSDNAFIGYCGLHSGSTGTPVEGEIEIAWRLMRSAWGQDYAREAALACFDWAFANLPIEAVWAKTVPANERSWRLMRRLGMTYLEGGDFDHPALSPGDPLRRHVLYRMIRPS